MSNSISVGCKIVRCVGGKLGKPYQREIERWLENNGKEWTAERLKAIWTAALHLRNGDKDLAIGVLQKASISYRTTGVPKGIAGSVVQQFVDTRRPSAIRRWSAVLRFYTGLTVDKATPKQIDRAIATITSPLSSTDSSRIPRVYERILDEVRIMQRDKDTRFSRERTGIDNPVYFQDLKGSKQYYSPVKASKMIRSKYYGPLIHSMLTTRRVPKSLLMGMGLDTWVRDHLRSGPQDAPVGRIVILQEGGAKARVIALPNAWCQLAMKPLHDALDRWTGYALPESCVRDQNRGAIAAEYAFAAGLPVVSLDLSAATDRLPRDIQLDILREIGLSEYADALEEISRGPWEFKDAGGNVEYSIGQPMGVYGSFPLLNIVNCLVARAAWNHESRQKTYDWFGRPGYEEAQARLTFPFRVLGDDIVFFDEKIAATYRTMMGRLGVEISDAKSFKGNLAQFAGFNIGPTSSGVRAFRPYKHPTESYVTNPREFLFALGTSVKNLPAKDLKRMHWERNLEVFNKTLPFRNLDLSPLETQDQQLAFKPAPVDVRWFASVLHLAKAESQGTGLYSKSVLPYLFETDMLSSYSYEERSVRPIIRGKAPGEIVGYGPDQSKTREIEAGDQFRPRRITLKDDPLMQEFADDDKVRKLPPYGIPKLGKVLKSQTHIWFKPSDKTHASFLPRGLVRSMEPSLAPEKKTPTQPSPDRKKGKTVLEKSQEGKCDSPGSPKPKRIRSKSKSATSR